ncbi:MAG: septum formation protein Maf [Anaerolineaceae bacterium]|nr:septum formation protein Maf [Anaerolineaceae bacterium]
MIPPKLLLASISPRRQTMLTWTGWIFDIQPSSIDETPLPGENARDYVVRISQAKAAAVAPFAVAGLVVVAADTIVVLDGKILGKPENSGHARTMLQQLRGRDHQVLTAISTYQPAKGLRENDLCVSSVPMRAFTDHEMEEYINSGDPLDKAGAYAIQHAGFHPVHQFSGCFASVMGLPLCHLTRILKKLNVPSEVDVPAECQKNLGYQCPIFKQVLAGQDIG